MGSGKRVGERKKQFELTNIESIANDSRAQRASFVVQRSDLFPHTRLRIEHLDRSQTFMTIESTDGVSVNKNGVFHVQGDYSKKKGRPQPFPDLREEPNNRRLTVFLA